MLVLHTLEEWRILRRSLFNTKSLGFIPTMGNLHAGHLSLVEASQRSNEKTIVSIFINRMQFNQKEDFIHYPRTIETDLAYLEQKGVDYCLLPDENSMYNDNYNYQIQESSLSRLMEGQRRPGHFTGMLTIVMKFLQLVKPQRVYFGEKDYQQYLLIQDMVEAFFLDVEVIACPTFRETSGLACSSRNNRLTSEEKIKADRFANIFHQKKTLDELLKDFKHHQIEVEYLEEHFNRRFIAVNIGNIRLIDNYSLSC